jgi:hypothetical protein
MTQFWVIGFFRDVIKNKIAKNKTLRELDETLQATTMTSAGVAGSRQCC